jgi:hypothetical protein
MRTRVLSLLLFACLATLTLSLIRAQDGPPPALPTIISGLPPAASAGAAGKKPAVPQAGFRAAAPLRDLSRLTPLQQQMLNAGQRGADWMFRMHGVKGRFLPGYLPALKQEMEGDHFLRQAGAAFALARAARFTGEERFAVRAAQALLALFDDTVAEGGDPAARHTSAPPIAVNRVASAALLVLAVCELPAPQQDLLDHSEQLCRFLHKQVSPSGALTPTDGAREDEETLGYPGLALYALARSHKHRPAGWKVVDARKALVHYRGWWKDHKSMGFVPYMTAACAETYLLTKDRALADFAFEMNDWLCTLQYTQIDPQRMLWYGGFMSWSDGRASAAAPTVGSAACAEGLVEACRLAREVGDAARYQRYTEALERCLQFLATLQYTEAGTQHFAAWYRPRVVGAFHPSAVDGNLRIDHTQHAVSALFGYLEHVVQ